MTKKPLLKTILFSNTKQWNAKSFFSTVVKSKYPVSSIGEHTIHITKKTKLYESPDKEFKILGISNERGMFDAYTEFGKNINQPYIKMENGYVAYNPYRVNVGSIGIKTKKQKNEFISPAYVVFKCKDTLLPEYLYLVLKSSFFNRLIRENTTGSVRQTLSYNKLSSIKIPVPTIEEQNSIIKRYDKSITKIKEAENQIINKNNEIDEYLTKKLGIHYESTSINDFFGVVSFQNTSRWDPQYLVNNVIIKSSVELQRVSKVIDRFMVDELGNPLRFDSQKQGDSTFNYIGMENIEKNTGKVSFATKNGKDIFSQTVRVPNGYILFGKLRPYLNKYWCNNTSFNNIICSSEFFVFNTKNIMKDYFLEILSSNIIQNQIHYLYSGARMPRINENDFKSLLIPIPKIETQETIVNHIVELKAHIKTLNQKAETLKKQAYKEFEEAVFGE